MLSAECLITALCARVHVLVVTPTPVSSETVIPTATSVSLTLRPTALAGEQDVILMLYVHNRVACL